MAESTSKMTFEADSTAVERSYDRMTESNKDYEKAVLQAVQTAARGYDQLNKVMADNNAVTRQQERQLEQLKKKLKEVTEEQKGMNESVEHGKHAFESLTTLVAGNEILSVIKEIIEAQEQWNKEVVKTQVEYDKVQRSLQVQALMKDKDFEKVRDEQIIPLARQYKLDMKDVTATYQALKSQGISDENMKAVAGQVFEGGRAIPGMSGGQMADFAVTAVRRLQQQGVSADQIDEKKMHGAIVPMTNIAGRMRMSSGSEFLSTQEKVGGIAETFGLNQDELSATLAAVSPHIGKEKAQKGLQQVLTGLKSDKIQGVMGEELSGRVNKDFQEGSLLKVFADINQALKQLSPEDREKKIGEMFPGRAGVAGRAFLQHTGEARGIMGGIGDETRMKEALGIATGGVAAEEQAVKTEEDVQKIQDSKMKARNEAMIRLYREEAAKAGQLQFVTGLEAKQMSMEGTGGTDLYDQFKNHSLNFGVLGHGAEARRRAAARYDEIEKEREGTKVTGAPTPVVPDIQEKAFARPFMASKEDEHIDDLKKQLVTAKEKVAAFEDKIHDKSSPGGEKETHSEKKLLAALQKQEQHLAKLVNIAESKKKLTPSRNGGNTEE